MEDKEEQIFIIIFIYWWHVLQIGYFNKFDRREIIEHEEFK